MAEDVCYIGAFSTSSKLSKTKHLEASISTSLLAIHGRGSGREQVKRSLYVLPIPKRSRSIQDAAEERISETMTRSGEGEARVAGT